MELTRESETLTFEINLIDLVDLFKLFVIVKTREKGSEEIKIYKHPIYSLFPLRIYKGTFYILLTHGT